MKCLKALVIDDDPAALVYMQHILKRRNYAVQLYDTPVQSPLYQCKTCPCALKDSGCPDLIISDFNMPVVNGVELLESFIKKGCHCRHLALISGTRIPEEALIRMARYGTRHFLKPLDFDGFCDWLDRVEYEITEGRSLSQSGNGVPKHRAA